MRGLVLKDFYNMKSSLLILVCVLVFLEVVSIIQGEGSGSITTTILVMIPMIIATNTIGMDEKTKWDNYAMTMPITRKDIIKSRYLTLITIVTLTTIIIIGINIFIQSLSGEIVLYKILENVSFELSIGIILSAIIIPIICKFGLEKARIALMGFILIPLLVGSYLEDNLIGYSNIEILISHMVYILPIIAILMCFISYIISVNIYKKKEF
ncbi:MAG: ABC-2 transporter permease [Clostridium perfringens]|nr:ABC-2 transporter permease [Clostridium perfringens]